MLKRILIASENRGKVREIREILSFDGIELCDLHDVSFTGHIEEKGSTFEENALIKADTVFRKYGIPVISDDSGLVIPFLGGRPGVYSSRFAGPGATDERNNRLLLSKLKGVPEKLRAAWFSCVAIFYCNNDEYYTAEGKVHGVISREPAGNNGFGYDPLFYLPEHGKTMAQLTGEEKNQISHRSKAFRGLRGYIEEYLKGVSL